MSGAPDQAAEAIVRAENLRRDYRVGRGLFRRSLILRALDGVSFELAAGRTLAVVGESGSGKSTLARQVAMTEQPTGGALWIDGAEVTSGDLALRKSRRRTVQMVFQDPYGSLNPRKTVGAILAEPLVIAGGRSASERRELVSDMLDRVGLRAEHAGRYPHMFSGGQRQRVAIARALMVRPRVVVADEPVSALDVSVQAQVINLMLDLKDGFGLAYLFVSHDLSVVRFLADDLLVLYLGRPVEQGRADAVLSRPAHPYTRALVASTPGVRHGMRDGRTGAVLRGEIPSPLAPPTGCAFRTRCPFAMPACGEARPPLETFGDRRVACHRIAEVADTPFA
jgi:dipeptide transport system ATP-binding protein